MHIYFHTFHILREPVNAFNKYKTVNPGKRNFYIINFTEDFSPKRSKIINVTVFLFFYQIQDIEKNEGITF